MHATCRLGGLHLTSPESSSEPENGPKWSGSSQPVNRQDLVLLVAQVTGTWVKTAENRIRRFLELIRAIVLRSQGPVTLATEE